MHHQEGWFLGPVIENLLFFPLLYHTVQGQKKGFLLPTVINTIMCCIMGGMLSLPGRAMKTVLPQLQGNIYLTKAVTRCSKQS